MKVPPRFWPAIRSPARRPATAWALVTIRSTTRSCCSRISAPSIWTWSKSTAISAHLGTLVYSFQDNTWRRVGHTFGSEQVRKAREALLDLIGKVSRATDSAWALRRRKDATRPEEVSRTFAQAVTALDAIPLIGAAKPLVAQAGLSLKEAAAASAAGNWDVALAVGGRVLRVLDEVLDKPLRVEPPPRCGTPLVYDPKNRVIVMFGGHSGLVRHDLWAPGQGPGGPGRLNDTWLYDCRTQQWRDVAQPRRPPATLWPKLVYDPASGLVLLVTWEATLWDDKAPRTVTLWGFDAAKTEWLQFDRQPWPGPVCATRHGASLAEVALDECAGYWSVRRSRRMATAACRPSCSSWTSRK